MKIVIARKIFIVALYLIFSSSVARALEPLPLLQALSTENHFALIRHALAPGNGDPASFDLADCSTQRNLDDTGRAQAVKIGEHLRKNGMSQASVFTSQWCRCKETAELLGLNSVTDNPILNSFYQNQQSKQPQTEKLQQWLLTMPLKSPVILVTHQVNITAFTGVYPSSGDMVIVKRNQDTSFTVLGVVSTTP